MRENHKKFLQEYLFGKRRFNATRSYMIVYPHASYDTASTNASRLLHREDIQAVLTMTAKQAVLMAMERIKQERAI